MKQLLQQFRSAVVATVVLAVLLCGIYPLAVWALAQLCFPGRAAGSLVRDSSGQIVGSTRIAQAFTAAPYFHPRPSAAGNGYDAANSGGSNLGPLSQKLITTVTERAAAYRELNQVPNGVPVPVDAVTASASGLDPDISPANAQLQSARVAAARGLPLATVQRLIQEHTTGPQLGFLGETGVNVLTLNLALDRLP